ncbi:fumarylacetoacetate hydrolase family protein, partial [Nocardia gipuzkoensis]
MRFATISDRLSLITASDTVIDIARASGGWFGPAIQDAYERWDELLEFCATVTEEGTPLSDVATTEFKS